MKQVILGSVFLILAAVGPNIFPAALSGHGSMPVLAKTLLIPSVILIAALAIWLRGRDSKLAKAVVLGALAGAVATLGLEAVRLVGFHFDYMPGNLPRLMGVLLLNRFAQGPSPASDIAGWAYHFWNGAAFGIIYVLIFGTSRRWLGALYGLMIGIGFMLSPVVTSLGVGFFGLQYSLGFPITVLLAHLVFGSLLALLSRAWLGPQPSYIMGSLRQCFLPNASPAHQVKMAAS